MKFRQQLDRWFQATFLSSAKGGAIALKAAAGTSVANQFGVPVDPLTLKQAAVIFLCGFFWHFNDCLASIQLPDAAGTAALPGAETSPTK